MGLWWRPVPLHLGLLGHLLDLCEALQERFRALARPHSAERWADELAASLALFAAETAEMLKRRAMANEFESLIVVAPPKMLGELRKHYHKEVTDRLVGELAKDLTGHPVPEIEAALQKA